MPGDTLPSLWLEPEPRTRGLLSQGSRIGFGFEAMAQLVKGLPCKHKDLWVNPQNRYVIQHWVGQRQVELWGSLATNLACLASFSQ